MTMGRLFGRQQFTSALRSISRSSESFSGRWRRAALRSAWATLAFMVQTTPPT